jgi:YVTN family beta-propeller protein
MYLYDHRITSSKWGELKMDKKSVIKIVAISIVLLFLISGFSVMTNGSNLLNPIHNKNLQKISSSLNDIKSDENNLINRFSNDLYHNFLSNIKSEASTNSSANYTEQTLVLFNNTLINGNFVSAGNGVGPIGVAYDTADNTVYVANGGYYSALVYYYVYVRNDVWVVSGSTNQVIATVNVGFGPSGAAYDSANNTVYVTNFGSSNVSVISGSTNQVIATVDVGSLPDAVAYDSADNTVYVANLFSNTVSVISGSTNKVIATVDVGSHPVGVAYDSANNTVYVANSGSNNVSLISGSTNQVIATVGVGSAPYRVAYDSADNTVYVTNYASGSVTIIYPPGSQLFEPYRITFTESGLPAGTKWYVNLSNGQSFNSTTNQITFTKSKGMYSYTIATVNKNYETIGGSFTVNGSNVDIPVTFTPVTFKVTCTETGLPSGTLWYFNLSNGQSFSSSSSMITFNEPNGTFSYTIETPIYTSTGTRYVTTEASRSLTVNGANVSIEITYTKQCYLTVVSNPNNGGSINPVSSWYNAGTSVTIEAIPNSNFEFVSWSGTGNRSYSGSNNPVSIAINGPITENANFKLVEFYQITFTETGLPSGTLWYFNLSNGQSFSSSSSMITFNEPNGTYSFTINGISGYKANQYSGTIIVDGSSESVNINWSIVIYPITITENGIPNGTSWSVTITGTTFMGQTINTTLSSTTNTITFNEPNGSYSYTIHLPSGYSSNNTKRSLSISGTSMQASVTAKQVSTRSSDYLLYAIVAVVIIVALGAVIESHRRRNK